MNNWIYRGTEFNPPEIKAEELIGFVYLIENKQTGQKYIGKKSFHCKGRVKAILKSGKKKWKKCLVESAWREYFGSSLEFDKVVETAGADAFTRTILHLCSSKAELSYMEALEQFNSNVLLDDSYSNGWIMVRVRKEHLRKIREDILKKINESH